ncbi:MAG: helix-turn-helix transcriptional regulator [Candidatus Omnitrophota bacterium]|nr:MAG: helix-turn-helix transcriptional regulator [Candidatus Omnitrophota bacterium]
MGDILDKIAKNVRFYRLKRGMTQERLAKKAGLSRGYISQIEHAKINLYLSTLVKLAKRLGVRPKNLVK